MAKGNMLLGYARGSVGDVTFSRVKGQQVQKARNRNPKNPNTETQVLQRAKFAAAGCMHKLATSNLFKFAFEDKTERESDFNAFMRHNIRRAPWMQKQFTQLAFYPAFAPWEMSQGSLPSLSPAFVNRASSSDQWSLSVFSVDPDMSDYKKVSELSQYLIASGEDWREGDIVTFVAMISMGGDYPNSSYTPSKFDIGDVYDGWFITEQMIVSLSDETLLKDAVKGLDTAYAWDFSIGNTPLSGDDVAIAAAVIHSRITPDGLQVSTQELVLNSPAQTCYDYTTSDAYKAIILNDWNAAQKAVLEGGLAKKAGGSFEVLKVREDNSGVEFAPVNGKYKIPASLLNESNSYLYIECEIPSEVAQDSITISPAVTGLNFTAMNIDASGSIVQNFTGLLAVSSNQVQKWQGSSTDYVIKLGAVGSITITCV